MAKGPEQKRVMNKRSLENLGKKGKTAGPQFTKRFREDLIDLWLKKTDGEGGTKGRHLLERAAEASPMAFVKMAAGLLPKETVEKSTVTFDFAETLKQLGGRVKNRELPPIDEDGDDEEEIIDVFPEEGKLPVQLEDNDESSDNRV
jgi:hypothetical protein